ncbi:DUF969 domain-containing protein [Lacticigenium naphthae]|uniref:DUF969 domain-containing protein n=1 Tax=Lacticigenium naphthae TaxID=515351 RepID=UPI0004142515|nr:DUF969 domain-containing protein [Lacticigenium naphthae]
MEYLRLIGIVIIVIGFVFKIDTIAVVLLAGLVTALVSGISIIEFLQLLGEAFVSNRLVTLFFLTLPMIGLTEKYGLRQQATKIIEDIKGLTPGRFLSLYMFIRELAGFFSIRIQGHTQFVRPLVEPMAQASAATKYNLESEKAKEKIKARSAAMENLGNFYAQNTFIAASGVLLITGTMESLGYEISAVDVAQASLPVALIALIMVLISNVWFDRSLKKKYGAAVELNSQREAK